MSPEEIDAILATAGGGGAPRISLADILKASALQDQEMRKKRTLAGMLQQNPLQGEMPQSPLQVSGGAGMSQGILSGGGRASYDAPISLSTLLQLYAGGGGAYGSVKTPDGRIKVREFSPEFGFNLKHRF